MKINDILSFLISYGVTLVIDNIEIKSGMEYLWMIWRYT